MRSSMGLATFVCGSREALVESSVEIVAATSQSKRQSIIHDALPQLGLLAESITALVGDRRMLAAYKYGTAEMNLVTAA